MPISACSAPRRMRLERFGDFIRRFDGPELYDRKNFTAISRPAEWFTVRRRMNFCCWNTCSSKSGCNPAGMSRPRTILFSPRASRGGGGDGLTPDKLFLRTAASGLAIVDIDSHYIPACDYKAEAEHYHHDVRFLFTLADACADIDIDLTESRAFRWMRVRDIPDNYGFSRLEAKLPLFL